MCTTQLSRQPAAAAAERVTEYRETIAAVGFDAFLLQVIAATERNLSTKPIAAAVAEAAKPAAALPVIVTPKPAPVAAKPQPIVQPAAARQSSSPRLQKLSTTQIAPGRYAFTHCGVSGEVASSSEGWRLTIAGVAGNRRYETKRHAVNSARLVIEGNSKPAAPVAAKPQPAAAPAAAAPRPAPAAAAAPVAPAGRGWKSADAPWRREPVTSKQSRLLMHLRGKMSDCGLTPASPLANQTGLNRGQASDLIDAMKSQLGDYSRAPRTATQTAVQGCSVGPFAGGVCTICGLVENRGR